MKEGTKNKRTNGQAGKEKLEKKIAEKRSGKDRLINERPRRDGVRKTNKRRKMKRERRRLTEVAEDGD